jgi:plasmid stabilization system protein ParE
MKLVFLASAVPDLRWFKAYYVSVFPDGRERADRQFLAIQSLLKANPYIGHPSDKIDGAREHHVLRTPFTFLYRVRDDRIEVMRVLDTRADWSGGDE